VKLANDAKNDMFFEIHKEKNYFTKDAMDKKHGFYYLRVGSNEDIQEPIDLKIKMFVKGNQLETSEENSKLSVFKYANDQDHNGDYKLTTYC